MMSLLPASEEFVLEFPSSRHLSLSHPYPPDLSSPADPTGSNTATGIAHRVTGIHNPLHDGKGEVPLEGLKYAEIQTPHM
jgi:hypothetical protein